MKRYEKDQYQKLDIQYSIPVFNRWPLTLDKAKGSHVWDINGNKYLDVLAGIAVNSIGHCHPAVVKAVRKQSKKLMHISNFYVSVPQAKLAEKLISLAGLDRIFFSNSGAEANEAALKLARKYAHHNGRGGIIIAMENCFHGRTLANIAMGKQKHQEGFDPIPGGFEKVPYNDFEALKNKIGDDVAGVMIESVQGEGGIVPADAEYMKQVSELCEQENILLIIDEIQTGMGRTGKFFGFEHFGIKPDIISMAKALGGGLPMGATLFQEKVAKAVKLGDHGTTFGGNPVACAAALAMIDVIEKDGLVEKAAITGRQIKEKIEKLAVNESAIKDVRGMGMMIGVELEFPGREVIARMMEYGVLGNVTADNVIRFVPPLNISEQDIASAINIFFKSLREVKDNE